MRSSTMRGRSAPEVVVVDAPAVPKVCSSALVRARRPAPRAVRSVPSMSNRIEARAQGARRRRRLTTPGTRRGRVDLGRRGPPAQREAERAVGLGARTADGAQHVRGLAGQRVARRARGGGHAAQVELDEHGVGLDAAHDDTRVVGQRRRRASR